MRRGMWGCSKPRAAVVGSVLLVVLLMLAGDATLTAPHAAAPVRSLSASTLAAPTDIFDFKNAGALVVDTHTGYLYIEDQGFGRVTVYDPARSEVVGYLTGFGGPMVMDPVSGEIVALRGDGMIFVNVTTGAVDATVAGLSPGGWWHPVLALDPVDGLVFASDNFNGGSTGITMGSTIQVVSVRLHAAVARIGGLWFTTGMTYDPADGDLYAVNIVGGLTVIDPRTDTVVGAMKGLDGPNQIAYDPANGLLYVACFNGYYEAGGIRWTAAVVEIDPGTLQIVGDLPGFAPPAEPTYVVYDPADRNLFVGTDTAVVAVGSIGAGWSLSGLSYPGPLLYDPVDGHVYVSSGDGLLAIDSRTFAVTSIGYDFATPYGLALDPTTNLVYASNRGGSTVTVIDASTNRVVGSLDGLASADSATYDPLADELFVGNEQNYTLSIVDLRTNGTVGTVAGVYPWNVFFDNRTGDLFVGTGSGLQVISGRTNAVLANLTGYGGLVPLAIDEAHGRVFALTRSEAFTVVPVYLLAIDTGNLSVAWNVTVTDLGITALGYDPVTNDLYAGRWAGGVEVLDASDGRNVTMVPGPFEPQSVLFDPANGYVYVASEGGAGYLWTLDPATNRFVIQFQLPDFPNGMVYDTANQAIYVAVGQLTVSPGLVVAVPSQPYAAGGISLPGWLPLAEGLIGIVAAVAVPLVLLRVRLRRRKRPSQEAPK